MKNVKPMLGALQVVGKDNKGQKIILPTEDRRIIVDRGNQKRPSWIKKFFNAFKTNEKGVLVRINHGMSKTICAQYNDQVHEKVLTAQAEWRRQRRILMGFEK